jgi:hypothetical protein
MESKQTEEISFAIPEDLMKHFGKELRIVAKPGPTMGIWNPDLDTLGKLVKSGALKDFDVVITPKRM